MSAPVGIPRPGFYGLADLIGLDDGFDARNLKPRPCLMATPAGLRLLLLAAEAAMVAPILGRK